MKVKKIVMVFSLGILILLGGCSSKTDEIYQNSIQNGLDAVAEDNFSKAEGLFETALDTKENDKTAKAYLNQVQFILEADDLIKQNKVEDAIKLLDKVVKVKEGSKVISAKSEEKKVEITTIKENLNNYNVMLSDAKELNESGNFQQSNEKLDALFKEDLTTVCSHQRRSYEIKGF